MINKKGFTEAAKNILKHKKGLSNIKIMHPAREWGIGLLVAVFIFTFSILWSTNTYSQYRDISIISSGSDDSRVVVYRETLVKDALAKSEERNDIYRNLTSSHELEEQIVDLLEEASTSTSTSTSTSSPELGDDVQTDEELSDSVTTETLPALNEGEGEELGGTPELQQ